MTVHEVSAVDLLDALRTDTVAERFGGAAGGAVVVGPGPGDPVPRPADAALLTAVPVVVVVAGDDPPAPWADLADVVAADALDGITATVAATPRAATALALLLRGRARRSTDDGLVAESAVYSLLQAGPEYGAWRASRPIRARDGDDGPRVRVERAGDTLGLTLTRPAVRNALDRRMRDELLDALGVARLEPALAVELRGEGPVFCAGGDLDEFGTRPDPATAHVVRLHRSVGRVLAALAPRTTAFVHGACAGSGVELAAFAGRVVAAPGASFALPELSLGLVPGAGGTVSLPARIGRHRTAWLALSGRAVDAGTALDWGLVDEVVEPGR